MSTYTRESLENMTVDTLREICKTNGISGMSKKRKDVVITAILSKSTNSKESYLESISMSQVDSRPITNMISVMSSVAKDSSDKNSDMDTTIHVSCGASSGNFAVVGKTVGDVAAKLKQILNIDRISVGIINGNSVTDDYIIHDGDSLEFVKPAGTKGC